MEIKQNSLAEVAMRFYKNGFEVTSLTGVSVLLCKAGTTSFSSAHLGTISAHLGNGIYKIYLDSTDTNTLGPLIVRVISVEAETAATVLDVVEFNSNDMYNILLDLRRMAINMSSLEDLGSGSFEEKVMNDTKTGVYKKFRITTSGGIQYREEI